MHSCDLEHQIRVHYIKLLYGIGSHKNDYLFKWAIPGFCFIFVFSTVGNKTCCDKQTDLSTDPKPKLLKWWVNLGHNLLFENWQKPRNSSPVTHKIKSPRCPLVHNLQSPIESELLERQGTLKGKILFHRLGQDPARTWKLSSSSCCPA